MENELPMRPSIQSKHEISRYTAGKMTAVMYDQVESLDIVEYTFVAEIFYEGDSEPRLYFTSEKNDAPFDQLFKDIGVESEPGGSNFFCAFDVDGHSNYGASDDWADATKFVQKVKASLDEALMPPD
jgi:hypothetical protein